MKKLPALIVCLGFLLHFPAPCSAMHWADFWKRQDQQAVALLNSGQAAAAAKKFTSPPWQGVAYYRAGDYVAAAQAFHQQDSAWAYYNLGNTLAQAKHYQDAILAYDQALRKNPQHADAAYNKKLLEKYLKENPPPPEKDKSKNKDKDKKQEKHDEGGQGVNSEKNRNQNSNKSGNEGNDSKSATELDNNNKDKNKVGKNLVQSAVAPQKDERDAKAETSPEQSPAAAQQLSPQEAAQGFASKTQGNSPDTAPDNVIEAVQDDPGGLLKQKFLRDYLRKQQENQR